MHPLAPAGEFLVGPDARASNAWDGHIGVPVNVLTGHV
jgi:hypothetical protein